MERHALHAPGPGRPAAPGQEGHGPAHAHLRRPLPQDPRRLPPRGHPRRRRRRRQPPHPARHHQQRHREARHAAGHLAVDPGGRPRPRRRRARPDRAPHLGLHRRVPHLRHALQGVPPHPTHAPGLLHPHPDRRAGQPPQQRRDRRPTGLHRPALQRGGQLRHRGHRSRRHVLPQLEDHAGRPHSGAAVPRPRPLRGPAHRLADQGGLQPQQRNEHGHAGALPGGRGHAGQAAGAPRGRGHRLRGQGGAGARHRHLAGHLLTGVLRLADVDGGAGHRPRLRLRRRGHH